MAFNWNTFYWTISKTTEVVSDCGDWKACCTQLSVTSLNLLICFNVVATLDPETEVSLPKLHVQHKSRSKAHFYYWLNVVRVNTFGMEMFCQFIEVKKEKKEYSCISFPYKVPVWNKWNHSPKIFLLYWCNNWCRKIKLISNIFSMFCANCIQETRSLNQVLIYLVNAIHLHLDPYHHT